MMSTDDFGRKKTAEVLAKLRSFKKPLHADFSWWKERQQVYRDDYRYLRGWGEKEYSIPPQDLLRTLDKFESLLTWLDSKSIGKEMSAYEKSEIACKLMDLASSRDITVALDSNPLDINLNCENPVRIEGTYNGDPVKFQKKD